MHLKRLVSILSILLAIGSFQADTQSPKGSEWKPGKFRNLVVGQSTRQEVLAALGKPDSVGKEEDTGVPLISYEVREPFPGFLYVYLRHGKLVGLTLGLKDPVDKGEIVRHFGTDYRIVHYDFDDCLATGGSAPVYQSANGTVENMEYPAIGVSVSIDMGMAREITFTDHPAGPAHSRCTSKKPRPNQSAQPRP